MKNHLLRVLACALPLTLVLPLVSHAQCSFTAAGPATGSPVNLSTLLATENCSGITMNATTITINGDQLYVTGLVTLDRNISVSSRGNAVGKLVVGESGTNVASYGSALTEATGADYTITLTGKQNFDALSVVYGSSLTVNNVDISTANAFVAGIPAGRTQPSALATECNLVVGQNAIIKINGRINVQGNFDITGTGGGAAVSSDYTTTPPAGTGLLVNGNTYATTTARANSFTATGSQVLVCVQKNTLSTCPTVAGAATGTVQAAQNCQSTVLPVTLTRFNSTWQPNGHAVTLYWTTASEKNNAAFVLERSADGNEFSEISRVVGGGNTTSTRNYSVIDETPLSQLAYYRLRQVDYDGSVNFSGLTSIKPLTSQQGAWLLPTGTTHQLLVADNTVLTAGATLRVLDATGREVLRQTVSSTNTLVSLPTLRPGVYLFHLTSPAGRLSQRVLLD